MTSSLDMIRGRSNVVTLTNNSGGALVAGDVCVQDTAGNEYATTTTSANSTKQVFIAAESIANGATGKFYAAGYCPLVTPSASVTRGRYLFTHTVAKQAAESATYGDGAFGVILKSGTTPSVWLFGESAQGAGGGAPDDAEYVTTAVNGDLSAEVAIPGLAGSPDIAGAGGAGASEEYDTATTGLTWNNTPTTVDSDTTIKSHLYIRNQADATERIGTKSWAPAGALDARCKIAANWPAHTQGLTGTIGLHIGNSDNSKRVLLSHQMGYNGGSDQAYTYDGGYSARGTAPVTWMGFVYLRITRDGSNNWSFYVSLDGILWCFAATQALTFTVANIGYRIVGNNSGVMDCAVDWLRTDV